MKFQQIKPFLKLLWICFCVLSLDVAVARQKAPGPKVLKDKNDKLIQIVDNLKNTAKQSENPDHLLFYMADYYLRQDKINISDSSQVDPSQNLAIAQKLLLKIITDFPDGQFADDAVYTLAYLMEKRSRKEARQKYLELLKRYPASMYKAHVFLRLGELAMQQGNSVQALQYFQNSLTSAPENVKLQALFQAGICRLMQNAPDAAARDFIRFLILAEETRLPAAFSVLNLKQQASSLLADCFLKSGGISAADYLLNRLNQPVWGGEFLWRLAAKYLHADNNGQLALKAYDLLLLRFPEFEQIEIARINRIAVLLQTGNIESAFFALNKFVSVSRSPLLQQKAVAPVGENLLAEKIENLWHQALDKLLELAKKSHDATQYQKFIVEADNFLSYFETVPRSVLVHWNRALALDRILKKKDAAFSAYLQMSILFPQHELSRQAAEYTISLAEIAMSTSQSPLFVKKFNSSLVDNPAAAVYIDAPVYSSGERKFLSAVENYARLFPGENETAEYLFAAANLCFQHRDFQKAIALFEAFLQQFPQHKKAALASYKNLQSYFSSHDYGRAKSSAQQLAITGNVRIRRAAMRYSEEIDKLQQASAQIVSWRTDAGISQRGALVLYLAGVKMMQVKQYDDARKTYQKLLATIPDFRYRESCLHYLAAACFHLGDFTGAAQYFQQLAAVDTIEVQKKNNLFRAAQLYQVARNYPAQLAVYEKFLDVFPHTAESENVLYEMALLSEKNGDMDAAIQIKAEYYQQYPNSRRHIAYLLCSVDSLRQQGNLQTAQQRLQRSLELIRQAGDGYHDLRAEVLFLLSEIKLEKFLSNEFRKNNTEGNIDSKPQQKILQELVRNYTEIRNMHSSYAREAQYRIAFCYEKYADGFNEMSRQIFSEKEPVNRLPEKKNLAESLYQRAADAYLGVAQMEIPSTTQKNDVRFIRLSGDAVKNAVLCLAKAADLNFKMTKFLLASPIPVSGDEVTVLAYENQMLNRIILPQIDKALRFSHRACSLSDSLHLGNAVEQHAQSEHFTIHTFALELLQQQMTRFMRHYTQTWLDVFSYEVQEDKAVNFIDEDLTISLNVLKDLYSHPQVLSCANQQKLILKKYDFYMGSVEKLDSLYTYVSQAFIELRQSGNTRHEAVNMAADQLLELQDFLIKISDATLRHIVKNGLSSQEVQKLQEKLIKLCPQKYAPIFGFRLTERKIVTDESWLLHSAKESECDRGMGSEISILAQPATSVAFWGSNAKQIRTDPQHIKLALTNHSVDGGKPSSCKGLPVDHVAHFRKTIRLCSNPLRAIAKIATVPPFTLFVNGKKVKPFASMQAEDDLVGIELTNYLRKGKNSICVHKTIAAATQGWAMLLTIQQAEKWPGLSQNE